LRCGKTQWGNTMASWYYDSYEPSHPKKAKGGIKAQSKRGAFGKSWWSKRWIEVLEGFNIGARLGRGRSYARQGQVLSIDIKEGVVSASVQGSRSKPYEVTIKIKVLSEKDWKKLTTCFSEQAIFAAKLLIGEMPTYIEDAFYKLDLSLFPKSHQDLDTNCSCPDWSNPCKHIAAVYYLLSEEFDSDPFLIFKLRGLDRKKLVKLIGGHKDEFAVPEQEKPKPEPLPSENVVFWGKSQEHTFGDVSIPNIPAALPKRLGNFSFWRGEENFIDAMERIYKNVSTAGLELFLGERGK